MRGGLRDRGFSWNYYHDRCGRATANQGGSAEDRRSHGLFASTLSERDLLTNVICIVVPSFDVPVREA